jgi:glucokinase
MPRHSAGIDLGGTKTRGVVIDHRAELVGEAVAGTPAAGGPRAVARRVAAVALAAASSAGIRANDLAGVGIGSAGQVDMAAGVVVQAVNLAGFDRPVRLAELVAEALGLDPGAVALDNDVNVATLAEHRLGAGRGLDDLLAVFVGTGVGGAVMLDGRLRRGPRGVAGEIGHIVVVDGGDPCPCGRRGCTEAYAGRAPMEWAVRAAVAAGRPTELAAIQRRLGRPRLTTEVLAEALAAGDALAVELVERAARALGAAIASAANLLDLRAVLLGGGLAETLGEAFARRIEAAAAPHLLADEPPLQVRPAELGDRAGAIGAALLVHQASSPSQSPVPQLEAGADTASRLRRAGASGIAPSQSLSGSPPSQGSP